MNASNAPVRICAAYKVFNGELYLPWSMQSIYDTVDRIVIFLSTRPWNGPIVPMDGTEAAIRAFPDPDGKIEYVVRDFRRSDDPADSYANELSEMNELLDHVRSTYPDITHYLYIDADEVYTPAGIASLRALMAGFPKAGQFHCPWRCYWKSFRYWIDPMEPGQPLVAFRIAPDTRFTGIRQTNMDVRIVVAPGFLHLHHFSYALPTPLVEQKLRAWSHCAEVVDGWLERVWLAWDAQRELERLHPVRPEHFARAVPADEATLPPVMRTHPYFGRDIV